MSSNYQKVYMNQIHSSSLLCQLAQLWKNQQLCDAIIRTGSVVTKAHRVVLVAACPMLQSMENASFGSHLEVRLAAEIKQESVNTFLQYLYEGFMMLTEENVHDVEKIAKLLQVESIITCCTDFSKCLKSKQGFGQSGSQYKYNYHDQVEFRHVRTTDLQKTVQERMMKRAAEMSRPNSPGNKRQRMHKPSSPDVSIVGANRSEDTSHGFRGHMSGGSGGGGGDTWDRIPQLNQGIQRARSQSQSHTPGVVEIREDSVEILQTEQIEDNGHDPKTISKTVSVSVAGRMNSEYDLQVVNATGGEVEMRPGARSSGSQPPSISVRAPISVSPLSVHSDSSSSPIVKDSPHPQPKAERQIHSRDDIRRRSEFHSQSGSQHRSSSDSYSPARQRMEEPHRQNVPPRQESDMYADEKPRISEGHRQSFPKQFTPSSVQSKPFAVGSAMQSSSSLSSSVPLKSDTSLHNTSKMMHGNMSSEIDQSDQQDSSTADLTPDLSIVKIERANTGDETGGLDMYVDMPDPNMMQVRNVQGDDDIQDDQSDYEQPSGDWGQEDMSNEGSNVSGDQSLYMGNVKESLADTSGNLHMYKYRNWAEVEGVLHRMVSTNESKLLCCAYCQYISARNRSGGLVRTRHKCAACDIPLCRGRFTDRDCFQIFHEHNFFTQFGLGILNKKRLKKNRQIGVGIVQRKIFDMNQMSEGGFDPSWNN